MDFPEYMKFLHHSIFVKKKIYTQKAKSIFSIDYSRLKKDKVKLLIFDVDETLTLNMGEFEMKTILLLKRLSGEFKIAIFSNCGDKRRKQIAKMLAGLNLYISPIAKKPKKTGFIKILEHFRIAPGNAAMIGDRTGTDMWGAYITGIKHRILVIEYPAAKDSKLNYFLKHLRNLERGFN